MAAFKMAALQKALDDSVSAYDLDKANKEFTTLTEKYRDLLEKSNSLVARTEQTSGFEVTSKQSNSFSLFVRYFQVQLPICLLQCMDPCKI